MRNKIPLSKAGRYDPHDENAPVSRFGPQHGLTPTQVWIAEQLLREATVRRGPLKGCRLALRMAGIISAVKGGRIGNAKWGRKMRATKAGKARTQAGPSLAALSRRGVARRKELAEEREVRKLTYGERLYGFRRKP